MAPNNKLELSTILDGLGHGILIFDAKNTLHHANQAARDFLGKDFKTVESSGWEALATLFNAQQKSPEDTIDTVRKKANDSDDKIRFHIYHSGAYIPCWMTKLPVGDEDGIMVTLDKPDWGFAKQMIDTFRTEMDDAIRSTQGHIDIINKTIKHHDDPEGGVEALSRRINGFTRLISVHMYRVGRLIQLLERIEDLRTGDITTKLAKGVRKIDLVNFFEDFEEELDEIMLVDPETEATDHRSRLTVTVPDGTHVKASNLYLTRILHDMLRNAIMYSMKATPIKIEVTVKEKEVEILMEDEGYGIREKEQERVFDSFKRARQPQIISEFGYGLSLHICRHEVEAMNGKMWFKSTESVGTKFFMILPLWREEAERSSASPSDT